MKCNKCGSEINQGSLFCSTCGMPVQTNNMGINTKQINPQQNQTASNEANTGFQNDPVQSQRMAMQQPSQQVNQTYQPETNMNQQMNQTYQPETNMNQQMNQTYQPEMNYNSFNNQNNYNSFNNKNYNNTANNYDGHNSIKRKAIKMDAKARPKGPLCITVILAFVVAIILMVAMMMVMPKEQTTTATSSISAFSIAIISIVTIIATIAITFLQEILFKGSLAISRNQAPTFGQLFQDATKNIGAIGKLFLGSLVFTGIYVLLSIIPVVGPIVGLIFAIYMVPAVIIYNFEVVNNPQTKLNGNLISQVFSLAKGHRIEFYGLVLSFMGWMILTGICGLVMIWLLPYVMISFANWYRTLKGEATYTNATKGLSNGAIVGIVAAIYVIIIAIVVTIAVALKDVINEVMDEYNNDYNYSDTDYDYDDDDYDDDDDDFDYDSYGETEYDSKGNVKGSIVSGSGVKLFVPNGFTLDKNRSFDVTYLGYDGSIYIMTDTYTKNVNEYLNSWKEVKDETSTCQSPMNKKINGSTWSVLSCENTDLNKKILFYSIKTNGKIKTVWLNLDEEVADDIIKQIEKNLKLE